MQIITENSSRYFQKIKAHLKAAEVYAELSYAKRLKVGAVIVRDDRIVSIGYNGTPTGLNNECEYYVRNSILVSKQEVCHSEMNAIMFAAKNGTSTKDCDIYITHSPCFECSKMIIQSGIKNVFYINNYRDLLGLNMIEKANINVYKVEIS